MSDSKPRVLLMGARRAGKSSIQKVVFHKMSPHETLFLDPTNKLVKNDIANSSFVQFEVWDFPGHIDTASAVVKPEITFGGCGALVWVIDAQDDHTEGLARLQATIATAYRRVASAHARCIPLVSPLPKHVLTREHGCAALHRKPATHRPSCTCWFQILLVIANTFQRPTRSS